LDDLIGGGGAVLEDQIVVLHATTCELRWRVLVVSALVEANNVGYAHLPGFRVWGLGFGDWGFGVLDGIYWR
jgi:hypothetical protein